MQSADDVVRAYFKAFEAGDATGLADLFADDGAILPASMPSLRGQPAIREALNQFFAGYAMTCLNLGIDRVIESADMALVEAHSVERVSPRDGNEESTHAYRELFGLRRMDGDWRIISYLFNA